MTDLPDKPFWDDLLDYIEERAVIPIVGSELVTVQDHGSEVRLERWLAEQLVADLGLPITELAQDFELSDIVALYSRQGGEPDDLRPWIHRRMREAALPPPKPLLELSGILDFDLFVTLTFDSLLAGALSAVRTEQPAESIVYSPNDVRDLPRPKKDLRQSVVFHLLGQASATRGYAICDADLLELQYGLQDRQRRPEILFDALRSHHLLILGCSFGDWLARFFLRTLRDLPLSQKRGFREILIDHPMADGLVLFLKSFSSETHMIRMPAAQFVSELARRWHDRQLQRGTRRTQEESRAENPIPTGAIFLSYAKEDLDVVGRLAQGLRAAGLEVWFDRRDLQPGEAWDSVIRREIGRCSLFLPVISRHALSEENRRGRYFWREWNTADDLVRGNAPNEVFIMPVVIDHTSVDPAFVPDSFWKAHRTSLPDGHVPPEFADRLKRLVHEFHRRTKAA
ncbi:MAG TPA: toll/interleukin-1 receptor domain-containing protein [Thermoanaerobaculia bacterium]|jgi:hypothetical protein|nr:toll/interleukin-1 receptor domain-containing protein [Thermoanaerobaculia bacterium]